MLQLAILINILKNNITIFQEYKFFIPDPNLLSCFGPTKFGGITDYY